MNCRYFISPGVCAGKVGKPIVVRLVLRSLEPEVHIVNGKEVLLCPTEVIQEDFLPGSGGIMEKVKFPKNVVKAVDFKEGEYDSSRYATRTFRGKEQIAMFFGNTAVVGHFLSEQLEGIDLSRTASPMSFAFNGIKTTSSKHKDRKVSLLGTAKPNPPSLPKLLLEFCKSKKIGLGYMVDNNSAPFKNLLNKLGRDAESNVIFSTIIDKTPKSGIILEWIDSVYKVREGEMYKAFIKELKLIEDIDKPAFSKVTVRSIFANDVKDLQYDKQEIEEDIVSLGKEIRGSDYESTRRALMEEKRVSETLRKETITKIDKLNKAIEDVQELVDAGEADINNMDEIEFLIEDLTR